MPITTTDDDQLNALFADKLSRIRAHLSLSRPKMANLLSIPPTTLKNYELHYRKAPASLLMKVNQVEELKQFTTYLIDSSIPVESLPAAQ